jgi:transcriptional regulator with XRE-family HTH domain
MAKIVKELRAWRAARDLTLEQAAAMVVVEGVPANKATWHGWETGRKIPAADFMRAVCELTGLSSDVFYHLSRVEQPKTALIGGQLVLV